VRKPLSTSLLNCQLGRLVYARRYISVWAERDPYLPGPTASHICAQSRAGIGE